MNAAALYPQLALGVGVFLTLASGFPRTFPAPLRRLLAVLAVLSALALTVLSAPGAGDGALIRVDAPGLCLLFVALAGALPFAFCSSASDEVSWSLFLGSALGFSLLAVSGGLLMLFVGLELMSLPVYLLVARGGGRREDSEGAGLEAAVKYFFAGGTAGSLFLFGMALYYADAHTLAFAPATGPLGQAGIALMGAAALFKVGAVPLHFWLPDVYEASSPELAGFLSTSVKTAGFLVLLRVVALAPGSAFSRALPSIAAVSMLFGAFLALRQQRLQRLLAYSSISHAGTMLLGVGAWAARGAHPAGAAALLFYLGAYAAMSNGSFVFLKVSGLETRAQLKGYAAAEPALAALFAVLMLSLAGIPPTAGFLAKLLIFWEAIKAGLYGPVLCAGLAALVSLVYYLGVVRAMYFEEGERPAAVRAPLSQRLVLAACAAPAALAGLAPWLAFGLSGILAP